MRKQVVLYREKLEEIEVKPDDEYMSLLLRIQTESKRKAAPVGSSQERQKRERVAEIWFTKDKKHWHRKKRVFKAI